MELITNIVKELEKEGIDVVSLMCREGKWAVRGYSTRWFFVKSLLSAKY